MKDKIAAFVLIPLILVACKNEKEKLIVKKWKTTKIELLGMNRMHEEDRLFMDTMTEKNPMLLDFKTVDSCKKVIQAGIDMNLARLKQNEATTFLELKENGNAYFTTIVGTDSSGWHLEDDELVLEDGEVTNIANTTRIQILELNDIILNVRTVMGSDTVLINMKPYKE